MIGKMDSDGMSSNNAEILDLKAIMRDLEEKAAAGDEKAQKQVRILKEAQAPKESTPPSPEMLALEARQTAEEKAQREKREAEKSRDAIIDSCKRALFENNSDQVATFLQHWFGVRDFANTGELEAVLYDTGAFDREAAIHESMGVVPKSSRHEVVVPVSLRGEPVHIRLVTTAYHSRGGYSGLGLHFSIDAIRIIANPEALKR